MSKEIQHVARYYRVEYDVTDTEAMTRLLDPRRQQVSRLWVGDEDDPRPGVSCCRSLEALSEYFGAREWTYGGGTRVLVLEGEETGVEDWDAGDDAVLIWPTRIVDILTLIDAGLDGVGEPVQND